MGTAPSAAASSVSTCYREPGRYVVTLEVVTAGGAYAATSKSFTVHSAPSPDSLPTIRGRIARSHKDPELSKAAAAFGKRLTGRWSPRAVLCWSELDWSTLTGPKYEIVAGFVEYRSPRQVNLSPDICRRMELVRYKRPRPAATRFTAFSMLVFTHEVVHTLGIGNEAAATCFALQLSGFMSRALGTNEAFASRLEVAAHGVVPAEQSRAGLLEPAVSRRRQARPGARGARLAATSALQVTLEPVGGEPHRLHLVLAAS